MSGERHTSRWTGSVRRNAIIEARCVALWWWQDEKEAGANHIMISVTR